RQPKLFVFGLVFGFQACTGTYPLPVLLGVPVASQVPLPCAPHDGYLWCGRMRRRPYQHASVCSVVVSTRPPGGLVPSGVANPSPANAGDGWCQADRPTSRWTVDERSVKISSHGTSRYSAIRSARSLSTYRWC